VHVAIRRSADGRTYQVSHSEPIHVTSSEPAELRRATQAIADALAETIAAAPEQWYSFKPIWPSTAEEQAALAERAGALAPAGS
jgi:lauroyl/myristoyl acyltransferase